MRRVWSDFQMIMENTTEAFYEHARTDPEYWLEHVPCLGDVLRAVDCFANLKLAVEDE